MSPPAFFLRLRLGGQQALCLAFFASSVIPMPLGFCIVAPEAVPIEYVCVMRLQ